MKWLQKLFGGGVSEFAPANMATFQREAGNVYVLRIRGVLDKSTVDRLQAIASQDIARGVHDLKLLLLLTEFRGWRVGDDWGNLDFFLRHEASVVKIAVVGDARWKDDTLTFLAAGHRHGEVRYFAPGDEPQARSWLAQ